MGHISGQGQQDDPGMALLMKTPGATWPDLVKADGASRSRPILYDQLRLILLWALRQEQN